ncbi:twin-arginine translocase TatA/TatE family subunit [Candidatus Saccharibacteria bacterium]|nr:twin-arginine translocase TatA/TatE family subunit [Candidatus Saccharibacteria bacterium]
MFGLGLPELIVILLVLLLLFGATRLPKLSRAMGESARELKKGLEEGPATDTTTKAKTSKKK